MKSEPPLSDVMPVQDDPRSKLKSAIWPRSWGNWFTQAWMALRGWTSTFTVSVTYDFGNILAQSQGTTTVTVTGAQVGDAVVVRPTTVVNGIIVDGTVTAADTVTMRAVNYSSGAIDPASQIYRVIVFQQ